MKKLPCPLKLDDVISNLVGVVEPHYQWPDIPKGWQLEFIVYPDGYVRMEMLHPVSGVFWSDDNGMIETPTMLNGSPLNHLELIKAGIPFMTTFGEARVTDEPREPYLQCVDESGFPGRAVVSDEIKQRFKAKHTELIESGMLVDAIDYDHEGNWVGLLLQKNLKYPEPSDQVSFPTKVEY